MERNKTIEGLSWNGVRGVYKDQDARMLWWSRSARVGWNIESMLAIIMVWSRKPADFRNCFTNSSQKMLKGETVRLRVLLE